MTQKFNPALLASIAAGASLGTNTPDVTDTNVGDIPIARIDPNPYQPRLDYDPIVVRERADSIDKHGLLQPIAVRRNGDRYTLIAGQTRLEAHKLLGRETIKSNIIDASDEDMASLALIENVQRSDLHPIEIQIALSREPFASMKDEEIRGITGYSLTKIRNIRSISRLSPEVREHLSTHRPSIGVELLAELQKYPEHTQIGEYHRILRGDTNRSDLRMTLQLINSKQKFQKDQEDSKRNLFEQSNHSYFISKSDLDMKKKKAFESELTELIKKYKSKGV
ncbi:ParB/RepB/Spo0J family partition protein [Sulfuricurvum sp.]|uniref:ParB/RepB/Spo0J family partition protein n=1 Tax=Sulfuricurvum sp. TaxID=2025608 RepID=UPI00263051AA|nr:ParB/RepB/Spo0J family partition protein [Sulfuricurvum sp.]MDD2267445.1 ParB/RepB/Spo0J family partition protein [Sulfuricurvum sp.]MDD2782833.1 ParB/RepB/Spo0J family partition protein [Sulfuricurvum sp.]